ncbi:MAG TPA: HlyD family efflux transporter periplasmic adaptor subunit [Planctomycetaceae bacterium]|nr:HlyD family efflux transporter periplasmic adaptor subunit [Planctomycetaceae bacterium]
MRWSVLILVVGVVATVGLLVARPGLVGWKRAPASDTTSIENTVSNSSRIFAGGTVEGTQRETSLRFEVPGRLTAIHVREGDQVRAGDVIAELDAEVAEVKLAEATTGLKLARAERERLINGSSRESRQAARARVDAVELQVRELEALLKVDPQTAGAGAIPREELDEIRHRHERALALLRSARARSAEIEAPARKDELAIADARIALAEGALQRERVMLDKTRLRAPTDGVVLRVLAEPGELVGPGDDRELFTLVNRSRTRVRAFVEEFDAMRVTVGQQAIVTADGVTDREYTGTVQSCAPYVRPKSNRHFKPGELVDLRVREVVIGLSDGADLLVGLPVDVLIDPSASGTGDGRRSADDAGTSLTSRSRSGSPTDLSAIIPAVAERDSGPDTGESSRSAGARRKRAADSSR